MDENQLNHIIERYEELNYLIHKRGEYLISQEIHAELTYDQQFALRHIHKRKTTTSSELAQFLNVNKSAITALIRRLEEKGLIKRERQSLDRRIVHLSLTTKGVQLFDECEKKINELVSQLIKRFKDQEIIQFIELYEKLALFLEETIETMKGVGNETHT
ncbi:DNA-binding MarR family transcriptional regulator [Pullulanibacillus pueri]|uniref:MarR family transcriptional regulator n=1 Tax=Pullulanibacillus pueri TaxID=1437324 RepID=A0A8J2ZS01_9BACL|nr:MarR family transcriptional regulator [Pullulanibacillus pueri]MBM7680043.1 DNA-binding MarR family transcriptional regulator [Pullulanibacillus pueri]GGH74081.1 MarR family transcriptional regulator [Pullulanibacillus pueri]